MILSLEEQTRFLELEFEVIRAPIRV